MLWFELDKLTVKKSYGAILNFISRKVSDSLVFRKLKNSFFIENLKKQIPSKSKTITGPSLKLENSRYRDEIQLF